MGGLTRTWDRRSWLLPLWLAWVVWVGLHYFVVPARLYVLFDGRLHGPFDWAAAVLRSARAMGAAGLVVGAAWAIGGGAIAPVARLFDDALDRALFRLAAGFAVWSYLFLLLAAVGLYRPRVIFAALAVPATIGARQVLRALATEVSRGRDHRAHIGRGHTGPPFASAPTLAFAACIAAVLACALIAALAPESEFDALSYHLYLPSVWLHAGRPVDLVEEYVSLYPLGWELLYGAAMAVAGPIAAKLLHYLCLPCVGATAYALTRRLFPRANPTLAAALTVAAPTVAWEATTAYADLALAWYVSLAIYAIARFAGSRDRHWLAIGACSLGFALAIKHLALVVLLIAVVAVVTMARRSEGVTRALRVAMVFAVVTLLFGVPWYARAYKASGNPVFPEMYRVFGAAPAQRWSADAEAGLARFKAHFGRPRSLRAALALPWDVTVHGAVYGGALGPMFLMLLPCLLFPSRGSSAARALAAGVTAYLLVWISPVSSEQLRFLLPIVPSLAVLAAEGVSRLERAASMGGRFIFVPTAVVAALLIAQLPPFIEWHERDRQGWNGWLTHVSRGIPLPVVAGAETEQAYLARTVPSYRAWQFIDERLPAESRVLTFSGGDQLYSGRRRLWSDAAEAHELTWGVPSGGEGLVLIRAGAEGITHVLFDRRQLDEGSVRALAIGSDRMAACCLDILYRDDRYEVAALSAGRTVRSSGAQPAQSAPGRAPRASPGTCAACGTDPASSRR